jgi:hypothetical protein
MLHRFKDFDEHSVKNAFFANYLAAIMMLRLNDAKGLRLVHDPAHTRLASFDPTMSDVNFWGRVLFNSDDPQIKKTMMRGHGDMLAVNSGRVLDTRVEKLMKLPMQNPNTVNWTDVCANLVLMKHRFELSSSLYDNVARSLFKWDTISQGAKRRAVGDSFLYLMQADPKSNLLSRMRDLAGSTMTNDIAAAGMNLFNFNRLREDGECAGAPVSAGGTSAGNIGTTNAILGSPSSSGPTNQERDLANTMQFKSTSSTQLGSKEDAERQLKRLKHRKRTFKIIKFKAPSYMKAQGKQK